MRSRERKNGHHGLFYMLDSVVVDVVMLVIFIIPQAI
jgi:hypothetical protein